MEGGYCRGYRLVSPRRQRSGDHLKALGTCLLVYLTCFVAVGLGNTVKSVSLFLFVIWLRH